MHAKENREMRDAKPLQSYLMVTTNTAGAAGIETAAVVITTEFAVVAPQDPTRLATFEAPAENDDGVMRGAKKPFGYVTVILAPGCKTVMGVKLKVIGTEDFSAMRSPALMTNDKAVTCVRMLPDDTAEDKAESADV
jgi:hypothetical protein